MLGNIAFIELYMQAKGSVGITDQREKNALHHAVANGHRSVTSILCELGSFENLIEGQDHTGNTPLFVAVKYNQLETLKILIEFNCNLFHRNARGDNCLHIAAMHNSQESLVILANFVREQLFDSKNREGMTPIEIAESLQNSGCAHTLAALKRNVLF